MSSDVKMAYMTEIRRLAESGLGRLGGLSGALTPSEEKEESISVFTLILGELDDYEARLPYYPQSTRSEQTEGVVQRQLDTGRIVGEPDSALRPHNP